MKVAGKIERLVERFCAATRSRTRISSEMDKRILNDALSEYDKSVESKPTLAAVNKRRITKLAAAAVTIIAVSLGVSLVRGPDMAGVAWGDVVAHMQDVDYVHVYWLRSRSNVLSSAFEVWCDRGQIVYRGNDGDMTYDDGRTTQFFNDRGVLTVRSRSDLAYGKCFFKWMRDGLLSHINVHLAEQIPTNVGDDFLIYTFEASSPEDQWFQRAFITVGKNSLLPIQVKALREDGNYDLFIYDYEAPRKPPEFFKPAAISPPNGAGQVVLDGEEAVIDIERAPDLKYAIVRLHAKYDGPADQFPPDYIRSDDLSQEFCRSVSERTRETYERAGGPIFRCDVTFVTDEGYPSRTLDFLVLRLNEARQCGVGAADGGFEDWPDGMYRNVRFSPWLKPTDTEDVFIVEIRCWIKTD
jgi:hypothetical protein